MLRTYAEIDKARQSFFFNIISRNANNTRMLFATVEKLTTPLGPDETLHTKHKQITQAFLQTGRLFSPDV